MVTGGIGRAIADVFGARAARAALLACGEKGLAAATAIAAGQLRRWRR